MCGMNVMWDARYTVLMYHLLMGKEAWRNYSTEDNKIEYWIKNGVEQPLLELLPFDRFGDIWCGILMKKCADILGKSVSTGLPYIRHERASNPFTNLKKEANGLEVNEKFWEYVDRLDNLDGEGSEPWKVYRLLGKCISVYDEFPEYKDYFNKLGDAMIVWSELFMER
jgi:hypothetical protein